MAVFVKIIVFGASLLAILAIYAVVRLLKLGDQARFVDVIDVQEAALDIEDGFEVTKVTISRKKDAALATDANGRTMLIRRHGNRFAGRILTNAASAREEVDALIVDPGPQDAQFGTFRLHIADAATWADAINRI